MHKQVARLDWAQSELAVAAELAWALAGATEQRGMHQYDLLLA